MSKGTIVLVDDAKHRRLSAAMPTEVQTHQSMTERILDWVRKCLVPIRLTTKWAAGSKQPRARSGGDPIGAQYPLADSDVIRALQAKLRAAEIKVSASMIQMVQLGDVRKALGDQWPKVVETAMSVAETLLRHRLDQSDIFSRYMDYGFVVVFTRSNPKMAELRAKALSQEISHLLLKKPELRELSGAQQVAGLINELTWADEGAPFETMTRELEARCQSKNRQNATTPASGSTNPAPGFQSEISRSRPL